MIKKQLREVAGFTVLSNQRPNGRGNYLNEVGQLNRLRKLCGQNVFLGIGQIGKGVDKDTGPMTELGGENRRSITDFNFSITTDKKGNFTGVRMGDTSYSIEDWNKRFTSQPTQQQ